MPSTSLFYRPSGQLARIATLAIAGLAVIVSELGAHDFWLVPTAFHLAPGAQIEVLAQTSSLFPTSSSAITTDRVAEARLIGSGEPERITDLVVAGTSLRLRARPATAGQRIVAVTLRPRTVRESPESFRRYLTLEGAPELLVRYEREGLLPRDSITRRYAKYAKTIVEAGTGGPRSYARVAGHPLEFVPLTDPSGLRTGDTLSVRLLYRGQPLRGAHVHAGRAAASALTDTAAARAAARDDRSLVTDSAGVARIPITGDGIWNVRTLWIVPASRGSGADWDVHWATLVVGARAGGAAADAGAVRPTSRADSAAVARTVAAYDAALEAGDSAAALALLAPDAVVLESGGVETREEYRSHHLQGDIAFARAVRTESRPPRIVVRGDVAWAWSTSITQGTYRERAINSAGAELMVLGRAADGRWLIHAIHWSSRTRR
jgi:ketosteroid isomerase-like protein